MRAECGTFKEEVDRLRAIYDEHAGLQDRFLTAGIVTPELAEQLGLTGMAARASGSRRDLRVDFPGTPYDRLAVKAAMEIRGDVAARVAVRFDEVFESLRLIQAIVDAMPDGPVRAELPTHPAASFGLGWVEGWRGDVLVAVEAGADARLRRCHCHDTKPLISLSIHSRTSPSKPETPN